MNNADVRVNNWLTYKPVSLYDFPQNYGALTSLDGIQNRAILARFENKSLLYNNLLVMNTSNPQAAYLGNPSIFTNTPIDFAETDLGYVGSQNKFFLKIPQGQITVDAKRGQVFLIQGTNVEEISGFGSGVNRFFTDHLAFEILRYFSNVDIDNHFNGIGLHGVYDSKFERVIITKLDYIPINKDVKYDAAKNEYYIETVKYIDTAPTTTTTTTSPSTTTTTTTIVIPPGAIPIAVLIGYQTISPPEDIVLSGSLEDICIALNNLFTDNVVLDSEVVDGTTYYFDEETLMLYNSVTNTFAEDGYYFSEVGWLQVTNGLTEQINPYTVCSGITTTTTTTNP